MTVDNGGAVAVWMVKMGGKFDVAGEKRRRYAGELIALQGTEWIICL